MTSIRETFLNLFPPAHPIPAGIYPYLAPPEDPRNYRLHLRIEHDGSGILIINAATILHLNSTAAEYAYYLVQNLSPEIAAKKMASRYHVSLEQARQDYSDFVTRIQTLINTPDLDPVTFLDFERQEPFSRGVSAPFRLDCALTYRLPEGSLADSAPTKRVDRELDTAEWKAIMDKAWRAGIPHIVFTGGEPTLREDLQELLAHAEENGQVSGLISDGLRLADPVYLQGLLQTGLDHLMLVLQTPNEASWRALENALEDDLFVAVHLTLTSENTDECLGLMDRLAGKGVKAISLSTTDPSYRGTLEAVRDRAAHLDMELVWNLPVPYSDGNPVALETGGKSLAEGAGRAWLYIEPDGDVLPSQGINRIMGNFLRDPWEKIWRSR